MPLILAEEAKTRKQCPVISTRTSMFANTSRSQHVDLLLNFLKHSWRSGLVDLVALTQGHAGTYCRPLHASGAETQGPRVVAVGYVHAIKR